MPGDIGLVTRKSYTNDDERWQAVLDRDAAADDRFYYSVRTTGVYCRPSCPSRLPLRKNVAFHASPEEAEAKGFMPCKRCRPRAPSQRERHREIVARACRIIERSEVNPRLDALAEAVGISKHHFHRIFKKETGITPREYARAWRDKQVQNQLGEKRSVTEIIYDAGYNSSGRFYENAQQSLGMTPTRRRRGGIGETIRFAIGECSLGSFLIGATEKGICSILLGDTPEGLLKMFEDEFPKAELIGDDDHFRSCVGAVVAFVDNPEVGLELPLDIRGTAFQQRVWKVLRGIPTGTTLSYSQVAKKIGAPRAVRAVAGACAANKIALAIPCHRVVRNDGSLSGYRWGVQRKRELLEREAAR